MYIEICLVVWFRNPLGAFSNDFNQDFLYDFIHLYYLRQRFVKSIKDFKIIFSLVL